MAGAKTPAQIAVAKIARERLGIESLEPRGRDRLDFYDLHVDSIRAALEEAFAAGEAEAARADRFTWRDGDVQIIEKPGDDE